MSERAPLTIAYRSNTRWPFCTESHVTKSLEAMGHRVVLLQEDRTSWDACVTAAKAAQVFLWTKTWSIDEEGGHEALKAIREAGTPSLALHLDRYVGLDREEQITHDPFWRVDLVVTADGGSDEAFAGYGVNHLWQPPAVYDAECGIGRRNKRRFPERVVFVGSHPYPHPEWRPYRDELLARLAGHYGADFGIYPKVRNQPIRGQALADLYATAEVVIGDSCLSPVSQPPGKYWCVDEDTEALTSEGWKRYTDIHAGDLLYTLNPDSWLGEWQPAQHVSVWPAEPRMMFAMEGQRHSSLTTTDHRWLVERHVTERVIWGPAACPECGREGKSKDPRWGTAIHRRHMHGVEAGPPKKIVKRKRIFTTSEELQQGDRIPLCAPCATLPHDPKYTDAMVELIAWLWTEGSWSGGRYRCVTQSHRVNGAYVARIRACLTAMFGPPLVPMGLGPRPAPAWNEKRDESRGMTYFTLNAAAGRLLAETAPEHVVNHDFILALTRAQLSLFVETSIDADGCRKSSTTRGSTSQSVTLAQKDGRRLDPFEMACALLGLATSRTWQMNSVWIVHVKTRLFTAPLRKNQGVVAELRPYAGEVWCPTTENGTWLARRRGTVYFTGNSDRVPETAGRGAFLVHPEVSGMEDWYTDGEHLRTYPLGDWENLLATVDYYLSHPDERRQIASAGAALVASRDTYRHRMATVLDALDDQFGIPEPRPQPATVSATRERPLPRAGARTNGAARPNGMLLANRSDRTPGPALVRVRHRGRGQFASFETTTDTDVTACAEVWTDDTYGMEAAQVYGKTVLEIGGNCGAFSVLAVRLGASHVHVYEPHPATYPVLVRNLERNGVAAKVTAHCQAVLGRARSAVLVGAGGGAHIGGPGEGEEVDAVGIREAIDAAVGPEGRVGFWKIDAEGAEWPIFEALPDEYLARVDRAVFEFHGPRMGPGDRMTYLDDDAGYLGRWQSMMTRLADHGRLAIFGHPTVGGIVAFSRF